MKLFILFTFYLMIIETSQMDCCCGNQSKKEYENAVNILKNCIDTVFKNMPDYKNGFTNIKTLTKAVQDYQSMYIRAKNLKNAFEIDRINTELGLRLAADNVNNENLVQSLKECVETFHGNLNIVA
ncbi:uncharacterized protein LOC126896839 isoform X2 [Daktulosphaira vitifoliae]|uniref:uncharacterized protein LOC126896839 isoform X2 n=1 Tax=Daktulosphaira vitifoliae TaxID=58002 RepID=UPI0021A996A6|nr:uncharacterized protein LOC126896839 isoform X2 [Daktulosphaira vitifoliae]